MSILENTPATAKVTSSVTLVTPDTAERWLSKNHNNRNVKRAVVNAYARDMASGRWQITGEAIKFDCHGTLIDGQHRLHAVVASNTPVTMFVIRGLAGEAKAVMDTGAKRTAADALTFSGTKRASTVAAAARIGMAVECGRVRDRAFSASNSEVVDWVDMNPDIVEAAEIAGKYARSTDCKPAMVAYTFMMLARIDYEDALAFWAAASEKIGLRDGDPVIAMTNRFAESRRNRSPLGNDALLSLIYRAWNYRRSGRQWKVAKVKSPGDGDGIIPIPEPR